MSRWIVTMVLLACLAPAVQARGIHARVEGPAPDGRTYTVRTYEARANDSLEPWALAEGVVNGKHRSVLLRLEPTSEHGVYRFTRRWPGEGRWVVRVSLGHPPAPATVVSLRRDGTVRDNKYYFHTDGFPECLRALRYRDRSDC